uniref:O-fucosyltransferase family protein n=1 Tax=viral metagenome TaxID=1070528 RepID=A0A6C0J614_9ZZZZ
MTTNKLFILLIIILFIIFLKKNNKEYFNNSKYLIFTGSLGSYGISHHKSNLSKFIMKANNLNLILIIPQFILHKKHNNGKEITNNLSKYIDYNNLLLNGKKIRVIYEKEEITKINKNDIMYYDLNKLQKEIKGDKGLIRFHKEFSLNDNIKFNSPIKIKNIALNIINKLKNYTCVHVRRTDRNNKQIDISTKAKNIIKKLKESNSLKNVYIMTDEPNVKIFDKIKNFYNVFYYFNFELLKNIKNDNYYLFQVENEIMNNADIKISTFKTNDSKYDNYLVNKKGFQ